LASEYVEVPWLLLQDTDPRDVVIATGESRTCYEFVLTAIKAAGLTKENCPLATTASGLVPVADYMYADVSVLNKQLHWEAKTKFAGVVKVLVDAAMEKAVAQSV